MTIHIEPLPLKYYVDRLMHAAHFAFAGFSDAEWYCITGFNEGIYTGQGQLIDRAVGVHLLDVVAKRYQNPDFMLAVPACIWKGPMFEGSGLREMIDAKLASKGIKDICFYERDMVLDEAAEKAELYPLIDTIRSISSTFIGSREHRDIIDVLGIDRFIEIPSRNLHLDINEMDSVVWQLLRDPPVGVCLFSAGIASALLIHRVYDALQDVSLIDCGSIWDAFVGIGSQREWRRQLYLHPYRLIEWRLKNVGS